MLRTSIYLQKERARYEPNTFTKTVINGAQVATASIGLNVQNQKRQVDFNLFPTEFFTELTVYKSPPWPLYKPSPGPSTHSEQQEKKQVGKDTI